MKEGRYLFTSESVSMGHPDKVADQISDALLDAFLEQDPRSRVACETLVTTGLAMVAGEVTSKAHITVSDIVRGVVQDIGYTDASYGFDYKTIAVLNALGRQSPDIAQGVDESTDREQGAGDQGLMFGYACNETPEKMPLPIMLAHRLVREITEARRKGEVDWLRPDSKSQVTVEYEGSRPIRVHTVVLSTQHGPDVGQADIRDFVVDSLVPRVIPAEFLDARTIYHVNPTGRFVIGGPQGDCGLTGRKIIVDTYGGYARHGGGAFSGKDPSKVDRSAAYAARWVAKNVVSAGLADRCEVQLAYAIGVAQPLSILVDTFGTGAIPDERIEELVREHFDLTPRGIIESLDLLRPIYRQTAYHGHFGREGGDQFTWERADKAEAMRASAGVEAKA